MKKYLSLSHTGKVVFALCISVIVCSFAFDTEAAPLFNGKNLDGWVNVNCAPDTWTVMDGMILCSGIPTGVLRTEKQYENYVLELEWRHMVAGGNAGLFVHADAISGPGMPFTRCVECQILDGNQGDIFPIGRSTFVPDKPHPKGLARAIPAENRMNPVGEWNHYRIESKHGMLTLAVNGKIVSRAYNLSPRKGYICLESEGGVIHYRNINIKELPGSNPPEDVVAETDRGFKSLYNGLDLSGWKKIAGNEGHWTAKNWILDYDGKSEAEGEDKHLRTEKEYGNYKLVVDWRLPAEPKIDEVPVILPNSSEAVNGDGERIMAQVLDAGDSGIYLRGTARSQINIWNWPVGSGELWDYRTSESMSPDIRTGATPMVNADNPVGKWNRFEITLIDETLTVVLNGTTVIRDAELPGLPKRGTIALQHHGDPIQFANIYIKELD